MRSWCAEAGAVALGVGRASSGHGAPQESRSSRSSSIAVAFGGSLDPRAAERRAHHHGRELERVAGRRVDDRIVSAGRLSRGPSMGWAGRGPRSKSGHPTSLPTPVIQARSSRRLPLQPAEPVPLTPADPKLCGPAAGLVPSRFLSENVKFLLKCALCFRF